MMDVSKPGTTLLIFTDQGPVGPCGQSMSTTCPHLAIHVFPSEDAMRKFVQDVPNWHRRGKNAEVRYLVVGEGGSLGTSLNIHSGESK